MSILTNLGNALGKEIKVRRWHWDATQGKWIEDRSQRKAKTGWSLFWGSLGFLDVESYNLVYKPIIGQKQDVPVGTYYYQFSFSDGLLNAKTFHSQLAKVVVTPEPIPATAINADTDNADGTPKVIYSDVDYGASAIVTPVDSTDDISWQASSTKDLLKFTPDAGRKTSVKAGNGDVEGEKYKPDSYYTGKLNKDPNTPGIPAKYKIAAGNVSKEKTVYVGGLAAYKKAADLGGTWSVDGLSDLAKASGSTSNWHYEWQFTDGEDKTITPATNSGVSNLKGDITNLANLNTEQPLTFSKDSTFMKDAAAATTAGKSYRAQLTLTTNVTEESSGSSNEVQMKLRLFLTKLNYKRNQQLVSCHWIKCLALDLGTSCQKIFMLVQLLRTSNIRSVMG